MSAKDVRRRALSTVAALLGAAIVLAGCATWTVPADPGIAALRARAMTQTNQGVQLSAAVLDAEDSRRIFGTDVVARGIQPVWIEVRNETDQGLWLLRSGTDPDYFSPLEVAWSVHVRFGGATNDRIDEHFDALAFRNPIPPGATRSGMLYTNPQPVTKLVNVDLLGDQRMIPFTLFLPVPGGPQQGHEIIHQYADSEITEYDDPEAPRAAREGLPCCATTAHGSADGEPLNVVLVGSLGDVGAALARRGYRRDSADLANGQWLFGRPPDLVVRKRAQAGASSHWLRIWRAPIDYRGRWVAVGQAGRPVGGRFRPEGAAPAPVHADVDEVRNAVIHDLMYSGGLEQIGFVTGVGTVPADRPRTLPDGAAYFTDGGRVVLFFGTRPRTFAEVKVLSWEPLIRDAQPAASRGDVSGRARGTPAQ